LAEEMRNSFIWQRRRWQSTYAHSHLQKIVDMWNFN